jgi:hypothetical protein
MGEALALLRFNISMLDVLGSGVDLGGLDHEGWVRLQTDVATQENELAEAARAVGQDGELIAPSGLVFAIWSRTHTVLEGSQMIDGTWRPLPVGLRVDDRVYPDGFLPGAEVPTVRYVAVTAGVIKNDLTDDQTPGAVYAYTAEGGDVRYGIGDPAYEVDLLPEPSAKRVFVRHESDLEEWTQTSFV